MQFITAGRQLIMVLHSFLLKRSWEARDFVPQCDQAFPRHKVNVGEDFLPRWEFGESFDEEISA
jgi:hypothetical protein